MYTWPANRTKEVATAKKELTEEQWQKIETKRHQAMAWAPPPAGDTDRKREQQQQQM